MEVGLGKQMWTRAWRGHSAGEGLWIVSKEKGVQGFRCHQFGRLKGNSPGWGWVGADQCGCLKGSWSPQTGLGLGWWSTREEVDPQSSCVLWYPAFLPLHPFMLACLFSRCAFSS